MSESTVILKHLQTIEKNVRSLVTAAGKHGKSEHVLFAGSLLEVVTEFIEAEELLIELNESFGKANKPLVDYEAQA